MTDNLFSVPAAMRDGKRVVFDSEGSYVQAKDTGKKITFQWHGDRPFIGGELLST